MHSRKISHWGDISQARKCAFAVVGMLRTFTRVDFSAIASLLLVFNLFVGLGQNALGAEPYQRFLEKLRDERLFDLALVYLADLQDEPKVSPQFKSEIALERGMLLYNAAALMSVHSPQRAVKLDDAEKAIREFLQNSKQHPRRGEAQLSLGNLLLTRAEEARTSAGKEIKQDIPEAVKFYTEAFQLFESTIKELAANLDQVKGARTDANDTAKKDYRDNLRAEIRRGQLLAASAIENRGHSRVVKSEEWKKDLETALTMYNDLYTKEKDIIGIRNFALYYRSGIQKTLGKFDDAIDGYQRIVDLEGIDLLRMLQTQAMTELIQLLASQGKFPIAVERAEKWEQLLRPDERQAPEVIAMKLELYRTRLAWAKELEKKDKEDRVASKLKRDTRELLRALLRVPGAHQEEVRRMMGELGVDLTAPKDEALPKVKNFSEAVTAATERIQRAETDSIGIVTLEQQIADPNVDDTEKEQLQEQLASAKAAVEQSQQQAILLLRDALRRYSKSDERAQLFDARQRLAYALLKQQQPWEAIAIGEFLAFSNPRTDQGLRAGAISLAGYGELFKTNAEHQKAQLIAQLQPFAEYLVATWPDSDEAAAAASALVQLALVNKQWEKAEQFLQVIPATSPTAAKLRRDAALTFYGIYLEDKRSSEEETEELKASRQRAFTALKQAVASITKDSVGAPEIEATNALVRLYLSDNQVDAAAELLSKPETSPIEIVTAKADAIPMRIAMDTFRTALQTEISQLASGKISMDVATKKMAEYIDQLEAAAKRNGDGVQTLAGIYVQLARDLKDLLSATKETEKRKKLAEALVIVTSSAGKKATAFNTKYWAADTLLTVAEELKGDATQAEAYAQANVVLDEILAKGKEDSNWMQPPGIELQVKLLLAKSMRGAGQFKEAIGVFGEILETNNAMLDVQIEAAKTYQLWGDAVDSGFHRVAMQGGRPGPNRTNLIWGFGKIANMVANNPKFTEQFYEARYQLAVSRYKYAMGSQDPAVKSKGLSDAVRDIESTAKLYPDLGGPAMKKKFDGLLKTIQAAK